MMTGRARLGATGLFVLLCLPSPRPAVAGGKGEEILRHVEAQIARVHDYTVTLDIVFALERAHIPPRHAVLYFKQPDKVHMESEGITLLPREGMAVDPARLLRDFSVDEVVDDSLHGAPGYRLTLTPRGERPGVRELAAFVDPGRWTVDSIVYSMPDSRTASASFAYVMVGEFWLPSVVTVTLASRAAEPAEAQDQPSPFGRRQLPRNGTITIRYSGYQVNTGLSDEVFKGGNGKDSD